MLPLAQTYALFFATPLLITLLAIPMLGEKVGIRRGLAVLVGLLGVLIVLRPGQADLQLGHLAALTAAVTGALASVIVRKIGQEERSVVLMLYPMVANFLVLGLALPFVYVPMPIEHLGMLGIIASFGFVATLLVISAYRTAEAVIVAPMQYSQIIWAAIYGWLFFDEKPDFYTWSARRSSSPAASTSCCARAAAGGDEPPRDATRARRPETGTMPRISVMLQPARRAGFRSNRALLQSAGPSV